MHSGKVPEVPGRKWRDIGAIANKVLSVAYPYLLANPGKFPAGNLFEVHLRALCGFEYEIQNLGPGVDAVTALQDKIMMLSQASYDDLLNDGSRARFTVAHELGHIVLHERYLTSTTFHTRGVVRLNRSTSTNQSC